MVPVVPPIIVEADERLLRNAGDHEAIRRVLAETVRHVGERTGVPVPAVQIMSVVDSRPGRYTIRLSDVPTRTGALAPRAGKRGRKFDAIARDLESAVTQNLDAFLGLQVVAALVERWRTHGPGDEADRQRLLARSVPDDAARVLLATILRGLAAEGVPLTDLTPILRALKAASAFPDPIERVEYVRSAVAATLPGLESSRRLLRLPANVEDMVAAGVRSRDGRSFLALPDQDLAAVRLLLADALADADPAGVALVVCTPGLRPFVRKLVALDQPAIPVLALDDVADAQPLPVTRPLGALRPRVVR
jgi:type III secretory pathway component EscV